MIVIGGFKTYFLGRTYGDSHLNSTLLFCIRSSAKLNYPIDVCLSALLYSSGKGGVEIISPHLSPDDWLSELFVFLFKKVSQTLVKKV